MKSQKKNDGQVVDDLFMGECLMAKLVKKLRELQPIWDGFNFQTFVFLYLSGIVVMFANNNFRPLVFISWILVSYAINALVIILFTIMVISALRLLVYRFANN